MKKYIVEVHEDVTNWKNEEGNLHREDGPAVEYTDGTKFWYINGKHHREDGPAIEYADGSKRWYINDIIHREDGPAIENTNGSKYWFINGNEYTEDEFKKKINPVKELTITEIEGLLGHKVKIKKG